MVPSAQWDVNVAIYRGIPNQPSPFCLVAGPREATTNGHDMHLLALGLFDRPSVDGLHGLEVTIYLIQVELLRLLHEPRLKHEVPAAAWPIGVAHDVVSEDQHHVLSDGQGRVFSTQVWPGVEMHATALNIDKVHDEEFPPLQKVQMVLYVLLNATAGLVLGEAAHAYGLALSPVLQRHPEQRATGVFPGDEAQELTHHRQQGGAQV
mmetsp:Transcript_34315/g.73073  ORF Transcript_34315/g.73073 Transcript_34315/m.73073 type:complete len:207 (+) Transcript_34315:2522-3142(+)